MLEKKITERKEKIYKLYNKIYKFLQKTDICKKN